jgi:stringent starvation protein B
LSQKPTSPKTPSSKKPYILRALYEWIVDNGLTPMIVIDTTVKGVMVPPQAIKDERVVLNISPISVFGLNIANEMLNLRASFSGAQLGVSAPIQSIVALYPREGIEHGLVFGPESDEDAGAAAEPVQAAPRMRVVDSGDTQIAAELATDASIDSDDAPPKARPTLRVVK